jgi:hypothetical protein
MHHHRFIWALGLSLVASGCSSSNRCATTSVAHPPVAAPAPTASAPALAAAPTIASTTATATPTPTPSASNAVPASSFPAEPTFAGEQADTHATRGLTGANPRSSMAPNVTAIPSPPAKVSVPPNAGVEASLKAMPEGIPLGHLSKDLLEGQLRDPARFARCRKGDHTRIDIDVVIYNGAALGVTVRTTPNDRVLNFCVERIVRDMTWIKELAVNRATVSI